MSVIYSLMAEPATKQPGPAAIDAAIDPDPALLITYSKRRVLRRKCAQAEEAGGDKGSKRPQEAVIRAPRHGLLGDYPSRRRCSP